MRSAKKRKREEGEEKDTDEDEDKVFTHGLSSSQMANLLKLLAKREIGDDVKGEESLFVEQSPLASKEMLGLLKLVADGENEEESGDEGERKTLTDEEIMGLSRGVSRMRPF